MEADVTLESFCHKGPGFYHATSGCWETHSWMDAGGGNRHREADLLRSIKEMKRRRKRRRRRREKQFPIERTQLSSGPSLSLSPSLSSCCNVACGRVGQLLQ